MVQSSQLRLEEMESVRQNQTNSSLSCLHSTAPLQTQPLIQFGFFFLTEDGGLKRSVRSQVVAGCGMWPVLTLVGLTLRIIFLSDHLPLSSSELINSSNFVVCQFVQL